jgi:hypothetical protein
MTRIELLFKAWDWEWFELFHGPLRGSERARLERFRAAAAALVAPSAKSTMPARVMEHYSRTGRPSGQVHATPNPTDDKPTILHPPWECEYEKRAPIAISPSAGGRRRRNFDLNQITYPDPGQGMVYRVANTEVSTKKWRSKR